MANFIEENERKGYAQSVKQGIINLTQRGVNIKSIINEMNAIRGVINTDADNIFDASDLTKMDAVITQMKSDVAALNTWVQAQ